jgi:hypothetical protein
MGLGRFTFSHLLMMAHFLLLLLLFASLFSHSTMRIGVCCDRTLAPKGERLQSWNGSHDLKGLVMRFVCFILLGFGTSTKDLIQSLDWFSPLFLLLPHRLDEFWWWSSRLLDAKTTSWDQSFSSY